MRNFRSKILFLSVVATAVLPSCNSSEPSQQNTNIGGALAPSGMVAPSFGRFVGTLTHHQLGKQQLAKLELISVRSEQNSFQLQGILTLHFGDVRSGEYVSYHYDNVRYEPISGVMTFDQADQALTIANVKFAGGCIQGDVRHASGDVGKLLVTQESSVKPTLPLIEPLAGEYDGVCEGDRRILQVQTFRSISDTHRTNNAFGAYHVAAQIAQSHADLCPGKMCVTAPYSNSSYNFYTGALMLAGGPRSQACVVEGSSIICGGSCRLTRVSKEFEAKPYYTWPYTPNPFPEQTPAVDEGLNSIAGNYLGYVFHDYLGVYQSAKLNFVTFQDSGAPNGSLRLSAIASLYFGGFDSDQILGFRFAERSYPLLTSEFLLDRADADLDARVKITGYSKNQIRGIWYSKLFGRVGEFLLQRDQPPTLPVGSAVMQPVAGEYFGNDRKVNVATYQGQAPLNSENPFYPLTFNGYTWLLSGAAPRRDIVAGSFDYYTGKIGMLLEGDNHFLVGRVHPDGSKLSLKVAANRFGFILQDHEPEDFVRQK